MDLFLSMFRPTAQAFVLDTVDRLGAIWWPIVPTLTDSLGQPMRPHRARQSSPIIALVRPSAIPDRRSYARAGVTWDALTTDAGTRRPPNV